MGLSLFEWPSSGSASRMCENDLPELVLTCWLQFCFLLHSYIEFIFPPEPISWLAQFWRLFFPWNPALQRHTFVFPQIASLGQPFLFIMILPFSLLPKFKGTSQCRKIDSKEWWSIPCFCEDKLMFNWSEIQSIMFSSLKRSLSFHNHALWIPDLSRKYSLLVWYYLLQIQCGKTNINQK